MQSLRFAPDYMTVPPLWHVGGRWAGAHAGDTYDLLSAGLLSELEAWVEEWARFHDCDLQDDRNVEWAALGRRLCQRTQDELAPHRYLIHADFEGDTSGSALRRTRMPAIWRAHYWLCRSPAYRWLARTVLRIAED